MAGAMRVTFTKVLGAPAIYRWAGSDLVASNEGWGNKRFPHDLGHWLTEAQVDLPYGYWSLAGQQAPFDSFTVVSGTWPKDRRAWLDRVRRKHGLSMLHAEVQDGQWLATPDLDVHASWPEIRTRLARSYAFTDSPLAALQPRDVEALIPFARRNVGIWEALPIGGQVEVRWPGANDLVVLSAS